MSARGDMTRDELLAELASLQRSLASEREAHAGTRAERDSAAASLNASMEATAMWQRRAGAAEQKAKDAIWNADMHRSQHQECHDAHDAMAAKLATSERGAAAMRDAMRADYDALSAYFGEYGTEHENENCPMDDTCSCPLVAAMHEASAKVSAALASDAGRGFVRREEVERAYQRAIECAVGESTGESAAEAIRMELARATVPDTEET